jgi:hypothetical protein
MRRAAFSSLAVVLLAGPALAEGTYIEVLCEQSSADSQFAYCQRPLGAFSFTSDGPTAEYALKLTAPSTHCALTTYVVSTLPDGFVAVGYTPLINANESSVVNVGSGYPAGPVTLYIQASSQIGGCNVGAIHSWGVTVEAMRVGG